MIDLEKIIKDIQKQPNAPDITELANFAREARGGLRMFVDRCEEGSVRSSRTYRQFKKILKME